MQQATGLIAGTSYLTHFIKNLNEDNNLSAKGPIIMCSRGESWGKKTLEPGWKKYQETKNILDALEASAHITELDPEDMSVGYGGLPNERGIVTLDASIMDGATHNCGSVSCLEGIKTPSSLARIVMERTDHMMLVGKGAQEFAIMHGFKVENLLTEKARLKWLEWKENLSENDDYIPPKEGKYILKKRPTGTINILCLNGSGDLAGLTTTSGLFGKIPGRIGDSPIIGAGLYVDNEAGAAGATGRGEEAIRICASFMVVEKMRNGKSPQKACEEVIEKSMKINGGVKNCHYNLKMVAISKNGEVGVASVMGDDSSPPEACFIDKDGFKVVTGRFYKPWEK